MLESRSRAAFSRVPRFLLFPSPRSPEAVRARRLPGPYAGLETPSFCRLCVKEQSKGKKNSFLENAASFFAAARIPWTVTGFVVTRPFDLCCARCCVPAAVQGARSLRVPLLLQAKPPFSFFLCGWGSAYVFALH